MAVGSVCGSEALTLVARNDRVDVKDDVAQVVLRILPVIPASQKFLWGRCGDVLFVDVSHVAAWP